MGRPAERPGSERQLRPGQLRELTTEQCWALLATQHVGRLGVVVDHYPMIFPVNYGIDAEVIVLRTGPGTKLTAAHHANVAFEVDHLDEVSRTGWNVLVLGLAEEVTDRHRDEVVERTLAAEVEPWAPGARDRYVRVIPHRVTGRWIEPDELPPAFEDAGYL
jgi:nitroimidazol reductase NimA-like FMN-containing flavoprotein (pyridoxamine 5'-phosphate oxidase superfamily)